VNGARNLKGQETRMAVIATEAASRMLRAGNGVKEQQNY
jgi:hypothetical protein